MLEKIDTSREHLMIRDIITALACNFLWTTYFVLCISAELWFILRSKTLRVQPATFKMLIHLDKCIVKKVVKIFL